jgi:hypothetical protein
VRLILQRGLQPPAVGVTKEFRKEQRAGVALGDRGVQELLDGGK